MTSWWRKTSRYLSSHSNFFIVTGGIVGGAYLVSQYAISKFQQIQDKLVNDKNAKENLRRRFAQNQEDCTFTVLALLPTLGDQLFSKHNVEQLTESLRSQAAPPPPPAPVEPTAPTQPVSSEQKSAPEVSAQPEAASPQLNPLAKTFVPANPGLAVSQSTPPTDTSDVATPQDTQPQVADTTTANPNTESDTAVSSEDSSSPKEAVQPASEPAPSLAPTDAIQDASATLSPQPSHMDAQEQRNKILADRQTKLRLWNDLKLTAFTRTITSLYCVVLLTLQTHIQLNLIGRFAYLASVEALARESDVDSQSPRSDPSRGLDHDTERLYLTFSWWFLHHGWDRLSDRVSTAIEKAFSPFSVKAQLSMADLKALLNDARYLIEHDAPPQSQSIDQAAPWQRSNFLDVLFPNSIDHEVDVLVGAGALDADDAHFSLATNHKLRALLDETKDIIESQDFGTVLSLCIDRVFDTFFDSLNPTFGIQKSGKLDSAIQVEPLSALESRFQEITEEMQHGKRVRLASLFPLVSRQSQLAIRGVPNEYIETLADSKELRAFSAVLYAAWSSL
ncbi:related to Peroxisomal assembly protein PEX3 [Sporisorium reilianum f. sp. reilianum]|uniref:Related to Peroxisomal assembly protein PEX3 n=1 Tax=Sporisorium reilianum f. sp. reilianum TaxID=72559 RepID=A0A2N8UP18_9BASI|nr:related to Peroxisomal assembly protein PEX3 [Sporisorium reilianum f. sp. reilianum]